MLEKISILFVLLFFSLSIYGQEALKPKPSPTAIVTMKYNESYVKVTYSQPHMRGRKIFGDLVAFGKVWRTGANESTEITVTKDVLVNGDSLKAGSYSIFSIPRKDRWTIIINKELGQWGSYNYSEKADVLRFDAMVQPVIDAVWEPFTIAFEQRNDKADLVMMWEKTKVSIPIDFIRE